MKRPAQLPQFWFRKPDQVDAHIMKNYPYVAELNRSNLEHHYDITQEILTSPMKDRVSWRGPTFYFKEERGRLLFALKWS